MYIQFITIGSTPKKHNKKIIAAYPVGHVKTPKKRA
jgi:hypothetical protein